LAQQKLSSVASVWCLWLISALQIVPALSIAVPKLWLYLAGNVLTQYPSL